MPTRVFRSAKFLLSYTLPMDYLESAYTTAAYSANQFQRPLLRLASAHSEQGLDTDGDNYFNLFQVTLEIDAAITGLYRADARLVVPDGSEIDWANTDPVLVQGVNVLTFSFSGNKIRQSGQDGPYLL